MKSILQILKKNWLQIDVDVYLKISKIEHWSYSWISRNLRSKKVSYGLHFEHAQYCIYNRENHIYFLVHAFHIILRFFWVLSPKQKKLWARPFCSGVFLHLLHAFWSFYCFSKLKENGWLLYKPSYVILDDQGPGDFLSPELWCYHQQLFCKLRNSHCSRSSSNVK